MPIVQCIATESTNNGGMSHKTNAILVHV